MKNPSTNFTLNPPAECHSLSEQGSYLLNCDEPIDFFDAIFGQSEFNSILYQTKLFRKQKKYNEPPYNWKEPDYTEIRCFIGLLLWTSLVQMPNRRAYFSESEIYFLPHFKSHMSQHRFEQLFAMLHLTNNNQLPDTLSTAKRFEAKLGNFLNIVNMNSSRLLKPGRALSIDEIMVKFYGRSQIRQYMKSKPAKYGIKLWGLACGECGYCLRQELYLGSSVESGGGRDVVLQLSEGYLDQGYIIYCDRFFSHLDLAAYLRSRGTGLVGTACISSLPLDLEYLVSLMIPLSWAYKWFSCQAKISYQPKEGPARQLQANEPVCLLVWMDKKYRTADKKVVFITNCLPAIPRPGKEDYQQKNIRDANLKYTRQYIPSPPILKAYNLCMGGVDKHDRLVSHHAIPLSSKRGYIKIFLYLLDSVVVNSWILFKSAKQAKGLWNQAAQRRHTLSWFKECVILSLCGQYTSRRRKSSVKVTGSIILPHQGLKDISYHQILPISQIPDFQASTSTAKRCVKCTSLKRTACLACKQPYCYECGREHILDLLKQNQQLPGPDDLASPAIIQSHMQPTTVSVDESDADSSSSL